MKRLLRRILICLAPVIFFYLVYLLVEKVKLETSKAAKFLQTAKVVNGLNFDYSGRGNRSGVPDWRTRTIVMARLSHEDTSWVEEELPKWQRAVYTVDDIQAPLHTARNKGREANAYLTYLVENYESLADFIVFLHSHKDGYPMAWHSDNKEFSNVLSVQNLRLDFVEQSGYVNLRCQHDPGCPEGLVPFRKKPDPKLTHELVFPDAWRQLMGSNTAIPPVIGVPCCSQFAVSKEQVLKRPKEDYERYLNWLMDTELPDALSGRVMEYMWHIIFGKEAVQ